MSSPALVSRVRRCAKYMLHGATLASLAVEGPEPVRAARYLVDTVDDLRSDLRALRAAIRGA